jgi:hypothetical protein
MSASRRRSERWQDRIGGVDTGDAIGQGSLCRCGECEQRGRFKRSPLYRSQYSSQQNGSVFSGNKRKLVEWLKQRISRHLGVVEARRFRDGGPVVVRIQV